MKRCSCILTGIISSHLTGLLSLSPFTLSISLSRYTNLLQSPFHPKLKLLILNKSIKCITLTPHTTNYNGYIHISQEVTSFLVLQRYLFIHYLPLTCTLHDPFILSSFVQLHSHYEVFQ